MMNDFNYYDFLIDCIKYLDQFPHASGGEGKAYYVGDDFVVKKYIKKNDAEFGEIFNDYCLEMQKFAENGLHVPKIYAWTRIPNIDRMARPECRYDYFILEERMKGRQLYCGCLDGAYSLCKDLCDKDEFREVVRIPNFNRVLFKEILTRFIQDYQNVNEFLCGMPKVRIDELLYDLYLMCVDGKFSIPDIFATNIILNKNGFSIIDNSAEKRINGKGTKGYCDLTFSTGLLWLFMFNNYVTNNAKLAARDDELGSFVLNQRDKVVKPCKTAIMRFISSAKSVCYDVKLKKYIANSSYFMLKDMLSEHDAMDIMSALEQE